MSFSFSLDPDLPMPLGMQLRGLIEYGIATGELNPGGRLPSVRELAERIGIAPMTVSQVYKDLQRTGLIEGRRGQGTYVRLDARAPTSPSDDIEALRGKADDFIHAGLARGFASSDLARLFGARLNRVVRKSRSVHLVMVGAYPQTTREYTADLRGRLKAVDNVTGVTIDELKADSLLRGEISKSDLFLTFANRKNELANILRTRAPIMAVSFIPADSTRLALASIDAMSKVGLVAAVAEFLPNMKRGVERLAPQLGHIRATSLGFRDFKEVIADSDVVIYATGAETAVAYLADGTQSFEYRHVLHPREVQQELLPLVEQLRSQASEPGETQPPLMESE